MKVQEYKDGVLVNEYKVPDVPVELTPEQERIAALEVELSVIKTAIGMK